MSKGSPRHLLLNEVMEAIAKLRELEGSTPKKISGQVEAILSKKRMQLQRDTSHITKALKHGVLTGLITRTKGRYKLGLAKRDYDVFKNLSTIVRDAEVYREHRRRGRRRGRRRRRSRKGRGRRRIDWEEDTDDNLSEMSQDTASSFGTPIPEDRGRKRRRRGRRRRRSGRKGRKGRRYAEEGDPNKSEMASEDKKQLKKLEQKSSNDSVKSSGSQPEFNRNKNEMDQDDENIDDLKDNENKLNCDNPGCLCNIMPPGENKHDNRKSK